MTARECKFQLYAFQDFKNQIREEYDTFEKETQQKFDSFVVKIDGEFSDYLSENFGEYDKAICHFLKAIKIISEIQPQIVNPKNTGCTVVVTNLPI